MNSRLTGELVVVVHHTHSIFSDRAVQSVFCVVLAARNISHTAGEYILLELHF